VPPGLGHGQVEGFRLNILWGHEATIKRALNLHCDKSNLSVKTARFTVKVVDLLTGRNAARALDEFFSRLRNSRPR
jgi:hypothetical protein